VELRQLVAYVLGGLIPILGILDEAVPDDPAELAGRRGLMSLTDFGVS